MKFSRPITTVFILSFVLIISSCKKQIDVTIDKDSIPTGNNATDLVLTPAGYMKRSNVHFLENGAKLRIENGRLLKVSSVSGNTIEDFGVIQTDAVSKTSITELNAINSSHSGILPVAYQQNGYLTFANLLNSYPVTISSFSTNWVVPSIPTNYEGQTIFIFPGMQDNSSPGQILQPVLQFGPSGAGGGNYWSIDNFFVTGSGVNATGVWGSLTAVSPGTSISGIITYLNFTNGKYNYSSSFVNYPSTDLNVESDVEPLTGTVLEAMEVYNIQKAIDFPADTYVAMKNININLTKDPRDNISWATVDEPSTIGAHAIASTNNYTNGEVDLYFRTAINGGTSLTYHGGQGGGTPPYTGTATVSAPPGQKVTVTLTQNSTGSGYGLWYSNFSSSVASFYITSSGTTTSTTSGIFVMPNSGSVVFSIYGFFGYASTSYLTMAVE